MLDQRHEQILSFLKEIEKYKNVERKCVTTAGRAESDAEHAWHMAMMVMLFEKDLPRDVDRIKLYKMALMHDLVEIYAGDTFAFDQEGKKSKQQREAVAADKLFSQLPDDLKQEFMELFSEFDEVETPESKHAQSFDKLQPMLQNLCTQGIAWKENGIDYNQVDDYKRHLMEHDPFVLSLYEHALGEARDKGYIQ